MSAENSAWASAKLASNMRANKDVVRVINRCTAISLNNNRQRKRWKHTRSRQVSALTPGERRHHPLPLHEMMAPSRCILQRERHSHAAAHTKRSHAAPGVALQHFV